VSTYLLRRLLLMIPMLFGISLLNFGLINLAPSPRSSNVQDSGDFDTSKSADANEGEHIFRQTFYLNRPVFLNTRYSLEDSEILWKLAVPLRPFTLPKSARQARYDLDDYGRVIVPHVLRIAEGEIDGLREDYERRWRADRRRWIKAGKPPGDLAWPPSEKAPRFDAAFRKQLTRLALARLANNAPRRPTLVYGDDVTHEIIEQNRVIRREQVRLKRIYADPRLSNAERIVKWREWRDENAAEWEYTTGDKARMLFVETRFAKFWSNLITFDLGTSYIHRQKVWKLIGDRIHISLTLSLGSLLIAYLLGIPLGIVSAVTHRSAGDVVTTIILFALFSLPAMFLGVLLVQYLAIDMKALPVSGFHGPDHANLTVLGKLWDTGRHILLPMITLTVGSLAFFSRYMKAGMIEIVRADYIRTARAKGLHEFVVVMKHAVRNGLIPIITLIGASLPAILGGSIIVEFIFEIDGMGKLAYDSVIKRDYAVIMGVNILTASLTMVGIFLADLAYAIVDPRISYR